MGPELTPGLSSVAGGSSPPGSALTSLPGPSVRIHRAHVEALPAGQHVDAGPTPEHIVAVAALQLVVPFVPFSEFAAAVPVIVQVADVTMVAVSFEKAGSAVGEATVAGLAAGRNRVQARWPDGQCAFEFDLPPASGDDLPDLGTLICR